MENMQRVFEKKKKRAGELKQVYDLKDRDKLKEKWKEEDFKDPRDFVLV